MTYIIGIILFLHGIFQKK